MAAETGLVVAAAIGLATVATGRATADGLVTVAATGAGGDLLVQASGFMGMAIPCCGIGITRIILTLSIPMMTGIMATPIMAIRITRTVILLPLPNGSRPHWRSADIIAARLTAK